MNARSGFASADGTQLYYEVRGAGDPIVFVHGFSFDRRMWEPQLADFARRFTVVTYDLRGFGKSAPGSESYAHADDLEALLDHLHIERVALVGLSLGGGAAINFAVSRPERIRALVAVDPSLGGFKWSSEFVSAQSMIRSAFATSGLDGAKAQWLAMPMFANALAVPAAKRLMQAMVADYSGWHWSHADLGRPFVPPAIQRLDAITAPTLVIVGEDDVADFQAVASTLEQGVTGATKVVVPGVGHMVNLEAPERFNELVLAFMSKAWAAP